MIWILVNRFEMFTFILQFLPRSAASSSCFTQSELTTSGPKGHFSKIYWGTVTYWNNNNSKRKKRNFVKGVKTFSNNEIQVINLSSLQWMNYLYKKGKTMKTNIFRKRFNTKIRRLKWVHLFKCLACSVKRKGILELKN